MLNALNLHVPQLPHLYKEDSDRPSHCTTVKLNEVIYGKGLEKHLGHRKSSTTLAVMIVFPSTTIAVACIHLILTAFQLCDMGTTDEKTKARRSEVTKLRSRNKDSIGVI